MAAKRPEIAAKRPEMAAKRPEMAAKRAEKAAKRPEIEESAVIRGRAQTFVRGLSEPSQIHEAETGEADTDVLSRSVESRHTFAAGVMAGGRQDDHRLTYLGRDGCPKQIIRKLPENMKKVAIMSPPSVTLETLFYAMDQNRPLEAIIQDIADKWTLRNPEDFALQFSEPSRQNYIVERNRSEIQNGNVLQLTDSPVKAAQNIIEKLKGNNREEKLQTLNVLSNKSSDPAFAVEFINKNGLDLIIDDVVAGSTRYTGDPLKLLLKSFVALMEHNVASWDNLKPEFTKQVAECVSGARAAGDGCIQPALEILENVIMHGTDLDQYITADKIIPYMKSKTPDVQQSAIALIIALFVKSSSNKEKRRTLATSFQSKTFRQIITSGILGSDCNVGPDMAHQLYKLQRLMLNMYEDRMNTKANLSDSTQVAEINKHIEDLRQIAFDFTDLSSQSSPSSRKSAVAKDYKKLGFANQTTPVKDFELAPPGLLALDNMVYFALQHKENYIKVVLENCGQDCPFIQASIQLTKILCDMLQIGESPNDEEHSFYPMFFTVDRPVEEFFSSCIGLLNRTWKEMRASREDFLKVLSVVKEQIQRALDKNQMPKDFNQFNTKLVHLAYPELKKVWEAERQKKDESKAQAKPILELREMIKPDVMELIKKHRLNYLEAGTRFCKYDQRGNKVKHKYLFWRLAPNHKAFHFGDCSDSGCPSIEQLPNKVVVHEIKELKTGSNCPHVKLTKKSMSEQLAFALALESSQPDEQMHYHFYASNDQEFNIWVDGINALLGQPKCSRLVFETIVDPDQLASNLSSDQMTSPQTREDEETLLNMEIKLRLLETEGITIPKDPPPIPPMPDNFNFAYTVA